MDHGRVQEVPDQISAALTMGIAAACQFAAPTHTNSDGQACRGSLLALCISITTLDVLDDKTYMALWHRATSAESRPANVPTEHPLRCRAECSYLRIPYAARHTVRTLSDMTSPFILGPRSHCLRSLHLWSFRCWQWTTHSTTPFNQPLTSKQR